MKIKHKDPTKLKVLLLASYCNGTDNHTCTQENPCIDCLGMCNVFEIDKESITKGKFIKTLEYLRK
jgi:hypothetical protein